MPSFKSLMAVSAVSLLSATAPVLAGDSYVVDGDHAWVQFSTNHSGWANARGMFRAVSGDIEFDKDDVTKSSVNIVIQAESVDTNHEARDEHLRSPDFLNAEEFSTIEFTSTRIEKTGDKTAIVYGDLELVGVTQEVALDVVWNAEAPLPWDASVTKTGFSATTTIDATEFGMNKVPEFGLGPDINFFIDIEAIKQ